MEQIVHDQIGIDDLSYKDEDGSVSGEDVIRDIIKQGKILVNERCKIENEKNEKIQTDKFPDEQIVTNDYYW